MRHNSKLEVWGQILKSKGFRLSTTKMKYLKFKFSDVTHAANVEARIETQVFSMKGSFKHLGS